MGCGMSKEPPSLLPPHLRSFRPDAGIIDDAPLPPTHEYRKSSRPVCQPTWATKHPRTTTTTTSTTTFTTCAPRRHHFSPLSSGSPSPSSTTVDTSSPSSRLRPMLPVPKHTKIQTDIFYQPPPPTFRHEPYQATALSEPSPSRNIAAATGRMVPPLAARRPNSFLSTPRGGETAEDRAGLVLASSPSSSRGGRGDYYGQYQYQHQQHHQRLLDEGEEEQGRYDEYDECGLLQQRRAETMPPPPPPPTPPKRSQTGSISRQKAVRRKRAQTDLCGGLRRAGSVALPCYVPGEADW